MSVTTWRNGWALALRMGRRDAMRHLGRSVLVVVMVALPIIALTLANVLASTASVSAHESIPLTMGSAQARISTTPVEIVPIPIPPYMGIPDHTKETPAKAIPGWGDDVATQTSALTALLPGSTLIPLSEWVGPIRGDGRTRALPVLAVDTSRSGLDGMVTLTSGRWARTQNEIVVTRHGIAQGLPASGTLQIEDYGPSGETWLSYTIVGVADAWIAQGQPGPAGAVRLPKAGEPATAFLVQRPEPVTWADAKRLAPYGVVVQSRHIIDNPPPASEWRTGEIGMYAESLDAAAVIWTWYAGVILLVETVLLVGPAFAVSAARQRRTLGLAALNGAPVAQLRRMVLGQAVVLGAASALVGALVGVAGAYGVVAYQLARDPGALAGPFEVPWLIVIGLVVAAIVTSVVAAMLPARGLGRLDLVRVLRGHVVSGTPTIRTPIAGLVLVGIGAALLALAFATTETIGALYAFGGLLAVIGGALLCTPGILVGLGRLLSRAPLPLRMAARDAGRQLGRTTSTVASMLGAVMVYTVVVVLMMSTSATGARTYTPRTTTGDGLVYGRYGPMTDARAQRLEALIAGIAPGVQVTRNKIVVTVGGGSGQASTGTDRQRLIAALRTGCEPDDVLMGPKSDSMSCLSLTSQPGADRSRIEVGSVASLTATYRLSDAARAALAEGRLVAVGDRYPANPGRPRNQNDIAADGTMTFVDGTAEYGPQGVSWVDGPKRLLVPTFAVKASELIGSTQQAYDPDMEGPGALLSETAAAALNWPTATVRLHLHDPSGPLSPATEERLAQALLDSGEGELYVERGYQPFSFWWLVVVGAVVGTIILMGSLVSTALSTAELAPFMGTLAAVGATRTTRRLLAAAQAWLLATVGSTLGVLVGLIPAVLAARVQTTYDPLTGATAPGIVIVPWVHLAIPVILIPLIAGLLAYAAVRRSPTVTRRTG
jgi:putative ABC transport system permease protein